MTEEINKKNKIDEEEVEVMVEEKKEEEPVTLEKINELLTNSLKWSQIIYEQNRKINRKLFWNSFFNYLKLAVIIIPLAIGFLYVLPNISNFLGVTDIFFDNKLNQKIGIEEGGYIESLLDQLPVDQAKKEEIKSLLR